MELSGQTIAVISLRCDVKGQLCVVFGAQLSVTVPLTEGGLISLDLFFGRSPKDCPAASVFPSIYKTEYINNNTKGYT